MSASVPPLPSHDGSAPSAGSLVEPAVPTTEIDASCRQPLLLFFVSGVIWLVVGLAFLLISSIKLHAPGFLSDTPWLTLGRVRPAGINSVLYGFASQTAIGVMLWIFCRLGRNRLLFPSIIFIGGLLWNLSTTVGIVGILCGDSTGFEWLEMPRYASPVLFLGYLLIGIGAAMTFQARRERTLYVSQWYLLAALFWFPWIYSAANLLLVFWPVRGTVQSIINAWFANNLLGLWLTPVALAAIFYFIPKLLERPLPNWWLAVFGFWTLGLFTTWAGLTRLVGGPVPAWMTSASIAANTLLILPLICVAMNWHFTLAGAYAKTKENITLRFVVVGAVAYLVASVMGIFLSLRKVSALTHFTYVEVAQLQLAVLGFVGMVLLGSVYYVVPRLLGLQWPSPKNVQAHFWCSALGLVGIFVALTLGGLVQAFKMNQPSVPFVNVVRATTPFVGLATIGWFVFLAGQIAFLANLLSLLRQYTEQFRKATVAFVTGADADAAEVRA